MALVPKYHATPAQILSEQEQVAAAKADPARFAPLYNKYYEPIFRFVYQRMDDKDQAFDLTAQVFLKAMTNLKKYEDRGLPFSSWLFRIAQNEMNLLFRSSKAQRTINVDTQNLRDMMEEMADDPMDEYSDQLVSALSGLEEGDLQLIEMRYFEKRPFKEIGEITDITENNAKVKVYRILDKLKKTINSRK